MQFYKLTSMVLLFCALIVTTSTPIPGTLDTTHSCGYCGEKAGVVLYSTDDITGKLYTINQCDRCNAYFLAPRPTPEQLGEAYQKEYYGKGEDKFKESWIENLLDKFRERRAKLITDHLDDTGKVLDIGCGNGTFLSLVNQHSKAEMHGIELPGGSAERAAKVEGINLKIGALEADDYEPNTFDAITLFHVFEHLDKPKETLDIITSILKPEGFLVMSFPNIDSWQSRLFKGKWFHMDAPRHLFFFTPKDFIDLMNEFGYDVIQEKHFNLEYNPYGTQQSILNALQKKREILYEVLKGNHHYADDYSKFNLFLQKFFFLSTGPLFILLDAIESLFKKGGTVEFVLKKRS